MIILRHDCQFPRFLVGLVNDCKYSLPECTCNVGYTLIIEACRPIVKDDLDVLVVDSDSNRNVVLFLFVLSTVSHTGRRQHAASPAV